MTDLPAPQLDRVMEVDEALPARERIFTFGRRVVYWVCGVQPSAAYLRPALPPTPDPVRDVTRLS